MNSSILKFMCQKSSLRKSSIAHRFQQLFLNQFSSASNGIITSNPQQFTVDYLRKSCSFPKDQALSLSLAVNFDTAERPDSVLAILKQNGFSASQITSIITKYPRLLLCSPEKTLLPKIEFFQSMGFSSVDIIKILNSRMMPITRSLEANIIPTFKFLKSVFPCDEDLIYAVVKCPELLLRSAQNLVVKNIELLRELGVPEHNIRRTLRSLPKCLLIHDSERLMNSAKKLEAVDIDNQNMVFVRCLYAMTVLNVKLWDEKMAIYKSRGCSEDEVLEAFAKHPTCMTVSAKKIENVLELLVDKLGHHVSDVFRAPAIFSLSVKERLVPRCAVYQSLVEKGLVVKRETGLGRLLLLPEKKFFEKYVKIFEDESAELMKIYKKSLKSSKSSRKEKKTLLLTSN